MIRTLLGFALAAAASGAFAQNAQLSDQQLIQWLDSLAAAPAAAPNASEIYADSLFRSVRYLGIPQEPMDIQALRKLSTHPNPKLSLEVAKRFFPLPIDSSDIEADSVQIQHYGLHPELEGCFALEIGGLKWTNDVYFFVNNNLHCFKQIPHKYGLELQFFRNESNTVVLTNRDVIESGTGIWEFRQAFYALTDKGANPLLYLLGEGNLQMPGEGSSRYWVTKLLKKNPLTIEARYYLQIGDFQNTRKLLERKRRLVFRWEAGGYVPVGETAQTLEEMRAYLPSTAETEVARIYAAELKKALLKGSKKRKNAVRAYLNPLVSTK